MPTYIIGPKALLLPSLPNGDPNPLWDLLNYADIAGVKTTVEGETASLGPMSDFSVMTVTTVLGVVQSGADVDGYPAWIEVDPTTNVPDYIDTREDQSEPLTWNDWLDANHTVTVIADKSYVPTDGAGSHLLGSKLYQLVAGGFTLKSQSAMRQLIAANTSDDLDP